MAKVVTSYQTMESQIRLAILGVRLTHEGYWLACQSRVVCYRDPVYHGDSIKLKVPLSLVAKCNFIALQITLLDMLVWTDINVLVNSDINWICHFL